MQTIRLFCDVARHHSVSQAAAQHGLTQSAVSQRISQLEKKLGVALMDRSVRPLQLTAAGELYLTGCLDLLERHDRLEAKISQFRQLEGHLRIDAIYSAGIDLLNHIKARFVDAHPKVSVTVNYKRPESVYDEVRQGRCDLGILSFPDRWRHVSAIALRDERMVVACQPSHPAAQQSSIDAAMLGRWPMVAFEPELPVGRHIRKYLRNCGVTPDIDNMFDNIDTIKNAVVVTGRIALLPRRTVRREVAAGTLAAVELEPKLLRPMGIIHARRSGIGRGLAPLVQAFVDVLLEHAGPKADAPELTDQEADGAMQLVGGHS